MPLSTLRSINGDHVFSEPSPQFYERMLNQMGEAVYFVDAERRIIFWNHAAEMLTGFKADEVVGTRCQDGTLKHVNDKGCCLCEDGCPLADAMTTGESKSIEVYLHHKEGHRVPVSVRACPVTDHYGRIIGCVETFRDNSIHQADLERIRELEDAAFVDALTGLANRRHLEDSLRARFAEYKRLDRPFGVLMLDIDHFKRFNDEHGHDVGDQVLRIVACTIGQNCRPYDTVGRWGGEEFLVISGSTGGDFVCQQAERLRALVATSSLRTPHEKNLSVTVSVGATTVQADDTVEMLLKRTDQLLYQSKELGRNCVTCCQ